MKLIAITALAILLRFYQLGITPPSLYWDETSLGYNAYSILKTAKDEHGKFLPITNFAAFGDYKPPLYIYFTVPSIALFKLTEFAVRFPSALFGSLTILVTYFLAKKIFENEKIASLSAFFLAVSPWHLQFSRAAFEANLALFFSLTAILLFFKSQLEKPILLIASGILFVAAMYTFTGQRLFVPIIVLVLVLQFRKQLLKNLKYSILTAIISLILFFPLFKFSTQTIEGKLRFEEVTIFKNLKPINDSIHYRETDGFFFWANFAHNRRLFFAHDYLIHYFDALNPAFLFFTGDVNPRLSIQQSGQLFYFEILLIPAGIYFLFAKKHKYALFLAAWLMVSPLGPATARETPHALRMVHILPTFQLFSAFGLFSLINLFKRKKLFVAIAALILFGNLAYYLHNYYFHYSKEYSGEWQYGYKQAVQTVNEYAGDIDNVVVTSRLGRPYIYLLFYSNYDPAKFHVEGNIKKDQFFFYNVESFGKFIFPESLNTRDFDGKTLYVADPNSLPAGARKIKTITDLKNYPVFDIGIKQ